MRIGIIGAENVGQALGKASVRAGHTVTITASHADEAGHVAAEFGATTVITRRTYALAGVMCAPGSGERGGPESRYTTGDDPGPRAAASHLSRT